MKLVFIYGPPGTGKFTVAQRLAGRTGFKLFDNHASINAVLPYFAFGTPPFFRIVGTFRSLMIEEAAKAGLDLIFTLVYAHPGDDEHVADLTRQVEDNGSEILFVRLWCEEDELRNRLQTPARAERRKLTSVETLDELLKTYDLFSPVPDRESLAIDNTRLEPNAVVERIIGHYGLGKER